MIIHLLDIGTDGRIVYQVQTQLVQSIFKRNHLIRRGVLVAERAVTEQITSFHVFPKKWKEHVTQMPAGHG